MTAGRCTAAQPAPRPMITLFFLFCRSGDQRDQGGGQVLDLGRHRLRVGHLPPGERGQLHRCCACHPCDAPPAAPLLPARLSTSMLHPSPASLALQGGSSKPEEQTVIDMNEQVGGWRWAASVCCAAPRPALPWAPRKRGCPLTSTRAPPSTRCQVSLTFALRYLTSFTKATALSPSVVRACVRGSLEAAGP